MKEIKHIAISQSAKTLTILVTIVPFIVVIPLMLYMMFFESNVLQLKALALLLIPILYGVGSYLVWIVIFFFYNWVAKHFGGIRLQIDE